MEQYLSPMILPLTSILLLSIFWYKLLSKKPLSPPLPPGPRGLPIVGYIPFLHGNLLHQFTDLARQYGPIFTLQLGAKLCIVIDSPSIAKEVVREHDAVFANRDVPIAAQIATYGTNDISFMPNCPTWRSLRKLFVSEMLSKSNLDASRNLRKDVVRKAIGNLYQARTGRPVEVGKLISSITLNVIMNMLWGGMMTGEEGENIGLELQKLVPRFVELIGTANISDMFPVLARLDIQGVKRSMEKEVKSLDGIFDKVILKRAEKLFGKGNEEGKKDFMQFLLERKDNEDSSEFSITENQIKAILMDIVVGGTDTTSSTIEWVMAELMNNQEVMEKLQNELADVVGVNNVVEESHMPKLHYLLAVLKETMRLHPAVSLLLPRCPSKTTVIGGYTIPKDTRVLINAWSIQRNPSGWDNPLEFKPERFLDETKLDFSGNNLNYLPFGSGRRICAGFPLAERMLIYLLASLVHSFDWELQEGEKIGMEETFGIALRKTVPLVVIPSPRLSKSSLYD